MGLESSNIFVEERRIPNDFINSFCNKLKGIHLILTNISKCPAQDRITDKHKSLQLAMEDFIGDVDRFIVYVTQGYSFDSLSYLYNLCSECYNLFSTVDYVYAVTHDAPSYVLDEVYGYFKIINNLKENVNNYNNHEVV